MCGIRESSLSGTKISPSLQNFPDPWPVCLPVTCENSGVLDHIPLGPPSRVRVICVTHRPRRSWAPAVPTTFFHMEEKKTGEFYNGKFRNEPGSLRRPTGQHPESSPAASMEGRVLLLFSHQVVSYPLQPHGLQPARLLCPWDSPGKNTGVGCHFLLQENFLTQGSNPHLLFGRRILYL